MVPAFALQFELEGRQVAAREDKKMRLKWILFGLAIFVRIPIFIFFFLVQQLFAVLPGLQYHLARFEKQSRLQPAGKWRGLNRASCSSVHLPCRPS